MRQFITIFIAFLLLTHSLFAEESRILKFSTPIIDFGRLSVDKSRVKKLTLYNKGNSPLTIEKLRFHENLDSMYQGEFSGVIPPNGEQNITIIFNPKYHLVYQGLLYIESDRTNIDDRSLLLKGEGIDENESMVESRILELGAVLNFSKVNLGQSVTRELIIYNRGNSPLTIEKLRFHERVKDVYHGDFSGVIPAHGEQRVEITFTPKEDIAYQGLLYIESDRSNHGDRSILLKGRGFIAENHPPVAVPDSYTFKSYSSWEGVDYFLPLLSNDSDIDGDELSISHFTHGSNLITRSSDKNGLTLWLQSDFYGRDSFEYTVNDGTVDGNTVLVVLNIKPRGVDNDFRPFITQWRIRGDREVKFYIPPSHKTLGEEEVPWVTVDWGDGTTSFSGFGSIYGPSFGVDMEHTYTTEGDYNISIYGGYYDNLSLHDSKIISVEQWGDTRWAGMYNAFSNVKNLVINAKDRPDTSSLTSLEESFTDMGTVDIDFGSWDISKVETTWGFLSHTKLSVKNYDSLLIGWSRQERRSQWLFASLCHYSKDAIEARNHLVNDLHWNIYDAGLEEE